VNAFCERRKKKKEKRRGFRDWILSRMVLLPESCEEKEKVGELKEEVERTLASRLDSDSLAFLRFPGTFERFLRGRNHNVQEAYQSLWEAIKWRAVNSVDQLFTQTNFNLPNHLNNKPHSNSNSNTSPSKSVKSSNKLLKKSCYANPSLKANLNLNIADPLFYFQQERTKLGQPIGILKLKHLCRMGEKTFEQFVITQFEIGRKLCMGPRIACVVVCDVSALNIDLLDFSQIKMMIKIGKTYFPELLDKVLVLNFDPIFEDAWNLIKRDLPIKTREKIKFIHKEELKDYILEGSYNPLVSLFLSSALQKDHLPQHGRAHVQQNGYQNESEGEDEDDNTQDKDDVYYDATEGFSEEKQISLLNHSPLLNRSLSLNTVESKSGDLDYTRKYELLETESRLKILENSLKQIQEHLKRNEQVSQNLQANINQIQVVADRSLKVTRFMKFSIWVFGYLCLFGVGLRLRAWLFNRTRLKAFSVNDL